MNLNWEQYIGPGGHRADGADSVYIILDEGNLVKLYQMPDADELSPMNPQRARKYREYGPGVTYGPEGHAAGYPWESALAEAKAAAQAWEDADA
jgi:hypothetical protein